MESICTSFSRDLNVITVACVSSILWCSLSFSLKAAEFPLGNEVKPSRFVKLFVRWLPWTTCEVDNAWTRLIVISNVRNWKSFRDFVAESSLRHSLCSLFSQSVWTKFRQRSKSRTDKSLDAANFHGQNPFLRLSLTQCGIKYLSRQFSPSQSVALSERGKQSFWLPLNGMKLLFLRFLNSPLFFARVIMDSISRFIKKHFGFLTCHELLRKLSEETTRRKK